MDLDLSALFGSSPKTVMTDETVITNYEELHYYASQLQNYLVQVLQLESVACKDWLTNKVDRCVGGQSRQTTMCRRTTTPFEQRWGDGFGLQWQRRNRY